MLSNWWREGVNSLRAPERAMLVITHYQRLLDYIVPDRIHVLAKGRIVAEGGKELALELEAKGYEHIVKDLRERRAGDPQSRRRRAVCRRAACRIAVSRTGNIPTSNPRWAKRALALSGGGMVIGNLPAGVELFDLSQKNPPNWVAAHFAQRHRQHHERRVSGAGLREAWPFAYRCRSKSIADPLRLDFTGVGHVRALLVLEAGAALT